MPVYRFYNIKTGVHFYTASETEKATVIKNLSAIYTTKGWRTRSTSPTPTTPTRSTASTTSKAGVHFYTASEAEKDNVVKNLSATYKLRGHRLQGLQDLDNASPVCRFYNFKAGVHFYTAREAEKDNVIDKLSATYKYEGMGYYIGN